MFVVCKRKKWRFGSFNTYTQEDVQVFLILKCNHVVHLKNTLLPANIHLVCYNIEVENSTLLAGWNYLVTVYTFREISEIIFYPSIIV